MNGAITKPSIPDAPGQANPGPWAQGSSAVVAALGSDIDDGLDVTDVPARQRAHGPNQLDPGDLRPWWRPLLEQFADPLVGLLLVAIVISALAWALEGADGAPFEAIVITLIVVANAGIGYWQEKKAEAAVAALAKMAAPSARVRRNGDDHSIATADVVPGDLLLLAEGDAVCADARLVFASSLKTAEAPLTGESEPVQKHTDPIDREAVVGDRFNMVHSGTAVTSGRGVAVVTATGMNTEMGRIAGLLHTAEEEPTPLQIEIARVGKLLGMVVVAIAVVVIAAILFTSDVDSTEELIDVLLVGVSLAVAAVPEGLPAILAVVLALGVQRMASKNAIVTKLSSVETLGSASVICTDKTGTLTRNEMMIERVATASGVAEITGDGYRPVGEMQYHSQTISGGHLWDEVRLVVGGGSLANDATLTESDGEWSVSGDPTEVAFLVAEAKLDLAEKRRQRFQRIHEIPFSSDRKRMTTVQTDADHDENGPLIITKGAPDVLLDRCTHEWSNGEAVKLTALRREDILDGVNAMADDALRTLGVAARRLGPDQDVATTTLETDLVYLGTAGIIDPPRAEARTAIEVAHQAGLDVVMITGDHPRTAGRIAQQLGITNDAHDVLTGIEIDALDESAFRSAVRKTSVFARVAPEHKLRIVRALRQDGNVVAMTGDGVNDAPALKAADIGVAMGITGTEVSKEASRMILADDNFATIVEAIREGRGIFDSIQKFLRFLLSSNLGEVLVMFLGVLGSGLLGLDQTAGVLAVPLLATQVLWINLITDAAPALALGVDHPIGDVMKRSPRRLGDRVIDAQMLFGIALAGITMAIATLLALDLTTAGGIFAADGDITLGRTMAFTTLVLAQLFNCLNSRSAIRSAFTDLFDNPMIWGAIGLSVALQVAVVHFPFLNTAFETTPLNTGQWALCVVLASSVLIVDELKKLLIRIAR